MIIDFHTHCFPDTLAPRAMAQLSSTVSAMDISPATDGTAQGLLCAMDKAGIDRSVICNIATNPHQMTKVNDFAISQTANKRFIPFGSLHPNGEHLEDEIKRLRAAGILGIKLHPDYMQTNIDDPAFDPIFELCEGYGMAVITHAGLDPISPDHMYCTPARMVHVLDSFPRLTFIAAHLGGFHCEAEVLTHLCGRNIYMDTSLISHRPEKCPLIHDIFAHHDVSRLLFATDTPWTKGEEEIRAIQDLPISQDDKERIFAGNALSLLERLSSNN